MKANVAGFPVDAEVVKGFEGYEVRRNYDNHTVKITAGDAESLEKALQYVEEGAKQCREVGTQFC